MDPFPFSVEERGRLDIFSELVTRKSPYYTLKVTGELNASCISIQLHEMWINCAISVCFNCYQAYYSSININSSFSGAFL